MSEFWMWFIKPLATMLGDLFLLVVILLGIVLFAVVFVLAVLVAQTIGDYFSAPKKEPARVCPQCGHNTEVLVEGYCRDCARANQHALNKHNAEFEAWEKKSPAEKEAAIKAAVKFGWE